MNWFLALVVIGLAIMVLVSLIRGIVAFLQTTKLDLNNQQDMVRASEMQAKQNKMMFARIKYQALAIVVVAILLAVNQ
jgi:predicted RND superfamily exporter protein